MNKFIVCVYGYIYKTHSRGRKMILQCSQQEKKL